MLRRYKYSLQDIPEPNLYRDNYSYDEVPKVTFNYRQVPMNVPEEIWLTDTTFRDGQQSRAPYTAKQIATLYDMLHRLGGPKGKIRQCEFFLYSENDRRAIEACRIGSARLLPVTEGGIWQPDFLRHIHGYLTVVERNLRHFVIARAGL